jgi:hypothetical protein
MGAATYELDSSHVPMLSQPERVIGDPYRRKRSSWTIRDSRQVRFAPIPTFLTA